MAFLDFFEKYQKIQSYFKVPNVSNDIRKYWKCDSQKFNHHFKPSKVSSVESISPDQAVLLTPTRPVPSPSKVRRISPVAEPDPVKFLPIEDTAKSGQENTVIVQADEKVKTEVDDEPITNDIEVINFSDGEDDQMSLNFMDTSQNASGQSSTTINVVDKKARMNPLAQG